MKDRSEFPMLLFLVFLVLKLCGIIAWSWWWVCSPILIPLALVVGILLAISIAVVVMDGSRFFMKKREAR